MNNKSENKEDIYFNLSKHINMDVFKYPKFKKSRDLLSIASGIFELEKKVKKTDIDEINIERFIKNKNNILNLLLEKLIAFVFLKHVNIKFLYSSKKFKKKNKNTEIKINRSKPIILFSGGIDSFSGVFWAKNYFRNIEAVFCAHSDQKWSIHIVDFLYKNILSKKKISLKTINVPSITKSGYSQLRGFLYILSSAAWMEVIGSDTLIISECGPTMYQPRFGPYDYVTMTTHPFIVETAHKVIELILERKIKILTPFENMTKAEVIAFLKNKYDLKYTHSCISQRFGKHDGTCYGCIIRRIGAIVAGVDDVEYNKDPFIDEKAKNENLISILIFSQNILINYEKMSFYETENIEIYNKIDLFKRFALDTFSAIYLLKIKGYSLVKEVEDIYLECEKKLGFEIFEERIKYVRDNKFKLNLSSISY